MILWWDTSLHFLPIAWFCDGVSVLIPFTALFRYPPTRFGSDMADCNIRGGGNLYLQWLQWRRQSKSWTIYFAWLLSLLTKEAKWKWGAIRRTNWVSGSMTRQLTCNRDQLMAMGTEMQQSPKNQYTTIPSSQSKQNNASNIPPPTEQSTLCNLIVEVVRWKLQLFQLHLLLWLCILDEFEWEVGMTGLVGRGSNF